MKIMVLIGITIIIITILMQRKQGAFRMTPDELKQKLDAAEPITIIDVRDSEEYRKPLGHIKGAALKPLGEMGTWADEFTDSDQIIVMVCLTGSRSGYATRMLRARGVAAYNLAGGINAWRRHGYPVN